MSYPWICWLYQYGVGGVVFWGTLWLARRKGALRSDVVDERRLLRVLVAGYLLLAALHGAWILAVEFGERAHLEAHSTVSHAREHPPSRFHTVKCWSTDSADFPG